MPSEPLLTPSQLAEEMHVTVATVRRWIASGELRALKAGPRLWTIRRSDVDRFLTGGEENDSAAAPSEDPSFSRHLVAPNER
jgi:excisionase family DNA binding protein